MSKRVLVIDDEENIRQMTRLTPEDDEENIRRVMPWRRRPPGMRSARRAMANVGWKHTKTVLHLRR